MADRIGNLNSNIIFAFITSICSFLIWTFAFNYPTLMGFCVVFGFTCGGYFALISPISPEILGMQKFPSGLSLLLMINAFTVLRTNIASAIETGVSSPPFFTYKMFTGAAYIAGALILIFLKFRLNRNPFVKI
jgi:MFS family permease